MAVTEVLQPLRIREAAAAVQRLIDNAVTQERNRCLELIQHVYDDAANRYGMSDQTVALAKLKARVLDGR